MQCVPGGPIAQSKTVLEFCEYWPVVVLYTIDMFLTLRNRVLWRLLVNRLRHSVLCRGCMLLETSEDVHFFVLLPDHLSKTTPFCLSIIIRASTDGRHRFTSVAVWRGNKSAAQPLAAQQGNSSMRYDHVLGGPCFVAVARARDFCTRQISLHRRAGKLVFTPFSITPSIHCNGHKSW